MNSRIRILHHVRSLRRADFLSPKDFVRRALLISVVFLITQPAGLREFTSVLSGTAGSTHLGWKTSAVLGATYIIIYLAFVVVVPILLIAALLVWLWGKV